MKIATNNRETNASRMTRKSCKYIGFFRVGAISAFSARYKKTTKSCLRTKKTALHNWSRLRSKKRSRIHQKYSQNAPKIAPKSSQRPPQSSQRAPQELHRATQKPPKLPTWSPKRPRGVQGVPEETSGTHFGSILTSKWRSRSPF